MDSSLFPGETKSPQKPNLETSPQVPSSLGTLPAPSTESSVYVPRQPHQQPGEGTSMSQAKHWGGLQRAYFAVTPVHPNIG